jgi:hypothetical protein
LLRPQGGEDGENERAAAEFETKVFESFGIHGCTVRYILCDIHYATHSVCVKKKMHRAAGSEPIELVYSEPFARCCEKSHFCGIR